ncbi:YqzE family protein [Caldibacillus lycopersici]|uniref:YqzE family protein n=1 Tax=Perspicuibacillus lycopersici TaxID=1325689 RepID=A0AAE3LMR1_9BACI|nr:YqzE family protein [Perspicuibacillus lycopersici]MCU9613855.1 YqzE family protein [Perspicuibacillus lycopersici]
MKTNEYVKFITQTVVEHFDKPKEERKQLKYEKKQLQEPRVYKYFGIMPYAVKEAFKMMKHKKRK